MNQTAHPSSFRDPSGYILLGENEIKRVINPVYFKQYYALKETGFYDKLIKNELMVSHEEVFSSKEKIILKATKVPFVTYPYEWSFNMYKEAALLTLKLQKFSLEHGFSLKDASAFNVTFHNGKAVFIDTLSFDFYQENSPWRAYKQFITHFFGPLLLAHYHGAQQLKQMQTFLEGIPVKTLSSLLPTRTKLNPLLYSNIHLLAKSEDKHNENYEGEVKNAELSKKGQLNIIKSLYGFIKKLELKEKSEWGNYYSKTNYSDDAFNTKSEIINDWVEGITPNTLIDIGGNDGTFVRKIKTSLDVALVSDIDNNAVDANYKIMKLNKEQNMLPLILDVLSPSPAIGLNNEERDSFIKRIGEFSPDVTLALAVIHHISLSGNVPFERSADFFARFSKNLIIEFPKREDSWVQRLLNNKADFKDYFNFYNIENFEKAYSQKFDIVEKKAIKNSERVIYLLKRKDL
ncbi:class I SAM-dependent methyltransferase [Winogradskyella sp. SYSU M77433]|uniref:class I SAM-dependent methyltransferase n=1 Tax=Winogradskyella sp. SYSU M77433 TaxID=3042722 RepID=UPI0024813629|nr:class I SAM-dependent methyltransferase [Winogradskyella sp. SYSU M77433]MDH7913184.1 class I SAM-dependent methyltransferase [Winogradskyella sp. SYSU M77433]